MRNFLLSNCLLPVNVKAREQIGQKLFQACLGLRVFFREKIVKCLPKINAVNEYNQL